MTLQSPGSYSNSDRQRYRQVYLESLSAAPNKIFVIRFRTQTLLIYLRIQQRNVNIKTDLKRQGVVVWAKWIAESVWSECGWPAVDLVVSQWHWNALTVS